MWPLVVMIVGVLLAAGVLALWVRYAAKKEQKGRERNVH